MNANKEFRANQLDEAHQDVLAVLDEMENIELTEKQVNEVVEHIAGNKDKIYLDYIDNYIRDINDSDIDSIMYRSVIKQRKEKVKNKEDLYK